MPPEGAQRCRALASGLTGPGGGSSTALFESPADLWRAHLNVNLTAASRKGPHRHCKVDPNSPSQLFFNPASARSRIETTRPIRPLGTSLGVLLRRSLA